MRKILARCMVVAVVLIGGLGSVTCHAETGINVDYHSQQEIRDYLKQKNVDIYAETTYSTAASDRSPYKAGEVSKSSLNSALNTMNAIRYIAGISPVELEDSYTKKEQAAALVNSANGVLSHYPSKPSGMSSSLYQLGASGASSGNLSWTSWKTGLGYHLVKSWMYDGDSTNIDRMGHRRWILNPSMEKTGFGWVYGSHGTYAAMYAFDNWSADTSYYGVAWPAQNIPVEYFGNNYPWSISMGTTVDASKVKVTLVRQSDQKKWTFSQKSADGYFNVENSNYGKPGCIIFRPENMNYQPGDTFTVKITGLSETVSYQVSFFSAETDEKNCDHSYGAEKVVKKATPTADGKKVSTCSKCGKTRTTKIYKASRTTLKKESVVSNGSVQKPSVVVKDSKGKTITSGNYMVSCKGTPKKSGMYQVTVKFKGNYSGTKKLAYTICPKKVEVTGVKPIRKGVTITCKRGEDISGYEICYSLSKDFKEKNSKTITVKGAKQAKNKITGLKGKTTYYVRVRAYKNVTYNGKKQMVYSSWSERRKGKTL